MILGAIIGAGAALLGGRADRNQRNKELAMQDPQYIRDRAEAAGFNPLLFTDKALNGLGYAPSFGSSIAQAGSIIARGFTDKAQLDLEKTRLDQENRRLEVLLHDVVKPSNTGGVFKRRPTNALSGNKTSVLSSGGRHRRGDGIPERDVVHKYIDVWDSDLQEYISIVNPELTESGPGETATGLATLATAATVQQPEKVGGFVKGLIPKGASPVKPALTPRKPTNRRPVTRPKGLVPPKNSSEFYQTKDAMIAAEIARIKGGKTKRFGNVQ